MSTKRKDKNGRVLKTGEYQRTNGTYEFRYQANHNGQRCSAYAKSLNELRKTEQNIERDILDGIDFSAGDMTVSELVHKYTNLKRGLSQNSVRAYKTTVRIIDGSCFSSFKIKNVKPSDAKAFYVELHDRGLRRNTIGLCHNILRPAFEMAVDDDMIRKNPFKFQVSDLLPNDAVLRDALSPKEQEEYLRFIRENGKGSYYDDIVILLGTGMRVSELYGLTFKDVDLKAKRISINHQLCRTADKPYFITSPKTTSGVRYIPMTDEVYKAFVHTMETRAKPKIEQLIDGYSGFIFLDKDCNPKVAMNIEGYMRYMRQKYEKKYGHPARPVTPHVLRHTFCTNLQRKGIDVKSLQYLMGHSNASVTLDVYTHTDYSAVQDAFKKAVAAV
ncbi:MAG: tyrosine-type recombinase/integrase [Candidatus Limivicinus sp.]